MNDTLRNEKTKLDICFLKKGAKASFLVVMFVMCSVAVFAQNRQISGVVVDDEGEPVMYAAVMVVETKQGTVTDLDGKFALNVSPEAKTLKISSLGYKEQTIQLKGGTIFNIKMPKEAYLLDEYVAIGYASVKRSDLTDAVSSISAQNIEDRASSNVAEMLQGSMAGVEVSSFSGALGELADNDVQIRIRGAASINAEASPLYVIDGIPSDGMLGINPKDIQSIDVLKDASSSAIYGSRGANGVIIITTKTAAKYDKVKVEASASFGIQSLERMVDVLTPEEWIEFRSAYNNKRYVAKYAKKGATAADDNDTRRQIIGISDPLGYNVTYMNDDRWTQPNYGGLQLVDWQSEAFRLAPVQNYQLSIANGGKNSHYRFSMGYMNQDGIAVASSFQRLTTRFNAESKILNNRVAIGANLSHSTMWSEGGKLDGKDNIGQRILTFCPIVEPDAGLNSGAEPYDSYAWASDGVSPTAYMENVTNKILSSKINTSVYLKVDIIDGLRAEVTGSFNYSTRDYQQFIPSSIVKGWEKNPEGYSTTARRQSRATQNFMFQTTLNYRKKIKKHNITAMAGFSLEDYGGMTSELRASQFPDNSLEAFEMDDVTITRASASFITPERLVSGFGRVQYGFDSRYLFSASIRGDGSTKFGRDNRWGVFPALSGAYNISNENFWPEDFVMNQMKVRLSWGINGNNKIRSNAALGLMESANYSLDGAIANGFAPTTIDNFDLGWEKVHSWNLGFDLSFFKNRISIAVDLYDKTTKDLLYQVSVPAMMGFPKAWGNIGNINNRGVDLELQTQNLKGKLQWTTNFNLSYNKNEVISLGEDNATVYTGYGGTTQRIMVGESLRSYYMYDAVGVYQTAADLENYPVMGTYNASGDFVSTSVVGDTRYRDVNKDGIIDDNDRTNVGKPTPDFVFGLKNTFKYRNFDLSILLTSQTGGSVYGLLGRAMDRPGMGASINVLGNWKNMWVSEEQPGDGKTPGLDNTGTGSYYDSRWIYSSDFLKIKNITIGYNIPINKKVLDNARIYVSMDNLFMWDKYAGGFSPEANNGGTTGNYDYGSYPQYRTILLGVNLSF